MKISALSEGGLLVTEAICLVKVNGTKVPYVLMVDTDSRIIECVAGNKKVINKLTSIIEKYAESYKRESISVVTEAYIYKIQIKKSCSIKLLFKEKV